MVLSCQSQDLVFPTSEVRKRTDFPQPAVRVSPWGAQQAPSPLMAGFSSDCAMGEGPGKTSCRPGIKACNLTGLQMPLNSDKIRDSLQIYGDSPVISSKPRQNRDLLSVRKVPVNDIAASLFKVCLS